MSVSIVTGCGLNDLEFAFRQAQVIFLSTKTLRPALEPLQLSFQLVREVPPSEIKRSGHEAENWMLSSVAVKNEWNPTRLQGLHGDNLYILKIIIIIIIIIIVI
jgi:hypothetical protein